MDFHKIKERLIEVGLKATHQRMVILNTLIEANNHPTVEHLFRELSIQFPTLSLATIYKSIESFEKAGLISRIKTREGSTRYEAKKLPHHHLYCEKTNKLIDYEDKELEKMIVEHFKKRGLKNFKINNIQLQINGEIVDARKKIFSNQ